MGHHCKSPLQFEYFVYAWEAWELQNGSYNPHLVDSDTIDIHWAFKVKFERQAICHKPYGHIIQIAYIMLECLCMQKCLFEHKIDHFCFVSYSFDLLDCPNTKMATKFDYNLWQ